jgi:uncharacterized protein (TIGR02145 family)
MRSITFRNQIIFLVFFTGLIAGLSARSEGTKQLKPDTTYVCYLNIQNGSSGYTCFATQACQPDQKLYVRVGNSSEKIYFGFGNNVTFRVRKNGTTVFGPVSITNLSAAGYIKYYSQAIAGPNLLSVLGYNAVSFNPGSPGDYDIEFNAATISLFDITVIDTANFPFAAIDGRLWSKDWGFNTSSIYLPNAAFLATQYIYSDDSVVTSIYYNQMRGNVFDVTSTSNGCYPPPMSFDSSCLSRSGNHHYAQYKIFLNDPDSLQFPTGTVGAIITGNINVNQQCDGSFIFSFWVNKPGSVQIDVEVNPAPGHQPEDVLLIDTVTAGWNTMVWNGLDGLGNPVSVGTPVGFSIQYINGLTNLALYDVERHLLGFVIQLIRPQGPPIAVYWNDTLLASKGGTVQLTGCFSNYPSTGCHGWNGDYYGVGIGSLNTVNSWWYASSSFATIGTYIIAHGPTTPTGINGPTQYCSAGAAQYTVVPNPLPGSDPGGYEWVLTDAATSTILLDLTNQGPTVTINFSLYPPGNKLLKVRGHNTDCGYGVFGPGTNGEGILITEINSPQIINTIRTFNMCSGGMTNILLQASNPAATFTYTASSSSLFVSGYSGGNVNPVQQTLISNDVKPDTVIYKAVPFVAPCHGDTVLFYVIVTPLPQVSNLITTFTQCSGDTTQINLTGNVQGAVFTWTATGSSLNVTGFSDNTGPVIAQTLINSGIVTETVTYSVHATLNGCSGPLKNFVVTVHPRLTVSISIAASSNPYCQGSSVNFSSTAANGGTSPVYLWKVNGVTVGGNLPGYSYSPSTGDIVTCTLTSNIPCPVSNPVTSNQIIMLLNTGFPAGVSISASRNPFCSGSPVIFTADPVNGGPAPVYLWKVNGITAGTNAITYTYIPQNGDSVWCIMTSNLYCVTGNPVKSNTLGMTSLPTPTVSFTLCTDSVTSVNAKPFLLKGGVPLGGTYSGAGVNPSTGIFNPTIAGIGNKILTYTYTASDLCSGNARHTMHIYASPVFTCDQNFTDVRDSRIYSTVKIGSQCWMAENLNFGVEINGISAQRDNCIVEKYCFGDLPASCSQYGGYYQWDEVMRYEETAALQGLCPPGWHVPTETEWYLLFKVYQGNGFAANPLKSTGFSGFNAMLDGTGFLNKTWSFGGFATIFWSSSSHGPLKAWAHGMNTYNYSVSYYPSHRSNAFPVRCIHD